MILAFDPGVCTGWAALSSVQGVTAPRLIACGIIEWEGFSFVLALPGTMSTIETLIVERPQVYEARLQKGDQEDIVATALRAGRLADRAFMLFGHAQGYREIFPNPAQWKKQVDKKIHNARVLAALSTEERALIPKLAKTKLHNCIDAVGLALWASGRL